MSNIGTTVTANTSLSVHNYNERCLEFIKGICPKINLVQLMVYIYLFIHICAFTSPVITVVVPPSVSVIFDFRPLVEVSARKNAKLKTCLYE